MIAMDKDDYGNKREDNVDGFKFGFSILDREPFVPKITGESIYNSSLLRFNFLVICFTSSLNSLYLRSRKHLVNYLDAK